MTAHFLKKQLEHDGINITVLAHAHFILKKSSLQSFMELAGCLQHELEPGQLWLDIAGESYSSSFDFDGFVLDMDKQEPSPTAGSSRGRQPAEKKSDQPPPGVTVALDQNRSSLPGATVQDQRQASLTKVRY